MADRIRVGIVGGTVTQGGSGWGANAHVPALKALPQYELKAVCTSHQDTAAASAKAFGAERGFHRFSDMAAAPDVDLIVVCVRVPGHRDLVMAGLGFLPENCLQRNLQFPAKVGGGNRSFFLCWAVSRWRV
jgi:predicted dehydrogenase